MTGNSANQVWLLDIRAIGNESLIQLPGLLSEAERRRYANFRRPLRQRQFLVGRALLRLVLADLFNVHAHAVRLQERVGDAPLLLDDGAPQGCSLSHSGPWVACALCTDSPVGLDIEVIDPGRDILALARQAFDSAQCAWLASCRESDRLRAFYRMWSEQEARIKLKLECAQLVHFPHPDLAISLASHRAFADRPLLLNAAFALDGGGLVVKHLSN